MTRSAICVVLAMVLIGAAPAQANPRTENYVAGAAGDTDGLCRTDPLNKTGLNVGAVCFSAISGTKAEIRITDAAMMPVAGYYVWLTSTGGVIGSAADFCGSRASIGVPSNAARLVVYIGGPVLGPLACIDTGYPGIGTNGSVKLTLT